MTPHEHANKLTKEMARLMLIKYTRGQKEHGGKLWENPHLLDMAIEEVTDLAFYLLSLRDQLQPVDNSTGAESQYVYP